MFKQTDKSYKNLTFLGESVKSSACGLCCFATAIYNMSDCTITLEELVSLYESSTPYKYQKTAGTDPEFIVEFASVYNLKAKIYKAETIDKNKLISFVNNGYYVMIKLPRNLSGFTGDYSHWIICYGYDSENDKFLCNNPNSSAITKNNIKYNIIEKGTQFIVIEKRR